MTIRLNHLIVPSNDPLASATFLAEILGLAAPKRFGPFWTVRTDNDVTLDFGDAEGTLLIEHYAFLVSEAEFDEIFGRIQQRELDYWADPSHSRPKEINRNDGGRGVYWNDPSGHSLEIITRPYGGGSGS